MPEGVRYDKQLMTIFNIIGSYFVDNFYNHLYLTAKDAFERANPRELGGATSFTDFYKKYVIAYLNGAKENKENYSKIVRGLHQYFQQATKFSTIRLDEFTDKIVVSFVPREYFQSLTSRNKDFIMGHVIYEIIRQFAAKVVELQNIRRIIDNHNDRSNIQLLTDAIVDIQIVVREEMWTDFVKKTGNITDTVSAETVSRIREVYPNALKEKCELEARLNKAKTIISQLMHTVRESEKQIEEYEKRISEAQSTLSDLKAENMRLRNRTNVQIGPSIALPKVDLPPLADLFAPAPSVEITQLADETVEANEKTAESESPYTDDLF